MKVFYIYLSHENLYSLLTLVKIVPTLTHNYVLFFIVFTYIKLERNTSYTSL